LTKQQRKRRKQDENVLEILRDKKQLTLQAGEAQIYVLEIRSKQIYVLEIRSKTNVFNTAT
jgi:hypothetical protein